MRPGKSIDFDKAQTRDDFVLRGVDLLNPTTSDGRFFLLPSFLFNSFRYPSFFWGGDDRTRRRKQKERWVDKRSASLSIYFPGLILFRWKIQSEEVRCVEWPSFSPYSTLRLSRVSKVKVYIIDAQRKDEVGVGHWTCSSSFYFFFFLICCIYLVAEEKEIPERAFSVVNRTSRVAYYFGSSFPITPPSQLFGLSLDSWRELWCCLLLQLSCAISLRQIVSPHCQCVLLILQTVQPPSC